jgi:hypothetical protein
VIYDDRIHTLKIAAASHFRLGRSVEIYIRGYGFSSGIFGIKNVEWEEVESGKYPNEPFVISQETAQELINSLWECGLRPAQGAGSAGQLETMKAHLEDMRKIAFKFLKIDE